MKSLSATWTDSKVLNVEYINLSDPKDDQVQIKVGSAGICGSDLHYMRGDKPITVGSIPGHEFGGFVSAVGKDIKHLKEGDLVGIEPVVRCGVCRFCITGAYHVCGDRGLVGETYNGGMSEYVNVPGYTAFRTPNGFDSELAALAEPLSCSAYGLERINLRSHENVLIIGAGTVGLGALIGVKAMGASAVIMARHPKQKETAFKLGADEVLADDESGRKRLNDLVKEHAFDVSIETVGGHGDTLNLSLESVRPLGRVLVLGVFFSKVSIDTNYLLDREMVGAVLYGNMSGKPNYQMALDVINDNKESTRSLVTHRYKLDDVQTAFSSAMDKSKESIKVHLKIN